MSDIQPDYTPYLNLARPDLHDDVDATVNKIRDAMDAIDAWAQASALPDVVTVIGDGGNHMLAPADRYVLVDASAGAEVIHFPPPAAGLAVTVVKVDTELSNSVFVGPDAPDTVALDGQLDNFVPIENPFQAREFVCDGTGWWSAGMGIALVNAMLNRYVPVWNPDTHQFETQQLKIENLTGVVMDPPFADGDVVTWDGTLHHWTRRPVPPPSVPPMVLDDLTDVQYGTRHDHEMLQFSNTDGKWENVEPSALPWRYPTAVFSVGGPSAFGDVDLTGSMHPNMPTAWVIDATVRANVTLPAAAAAFDPENLYSAVVTLKKIDASANPVHIVPNGSEKIDGAANLDITTRWASRTLVTDGSNWFTV